MRYRSRRKTRQRRHYGWGILLAAAVVAVYGFVSYRQALPALAANSSFWTPNAAAAIEAPWPKYGQSALGVVGSGVLATQGAQKAVPTASVTKIMVALSVLHQKPLQPGQQGPTMTVTKADVDLFHQYLAKDGSVIQVKAGEKITEYQALEAMLLPSANNMADMLAKWTFGSLQDYSDSANNLARELGMTDSHFGSADASGFSPQTVSTAQDLVRLGEAALQNPVITRIVSQKYAKVPVAGVIPNGNWRLGIDGVNGIKTGNTDQAGGVYLFSAKQTLKTGQHVTVVGAIMGAPTLGRAMNDSAPLLRSATTNLKATTTIRAGQKVAEYRVPWGGHIDAIATRAATTITWQGQPAAPKVTLQPLQMPLAKGDKIGTITLVNNNSISVIASKAVNPPTWYWRALRNL